MFSSIYSSVSGYWVPEDTKSPLLDLSNHQILKISNALEEINKPLDLDLPCLDLPCLVVVGTQSSGKSSVLNRIITTDVLPTGKSMVTRTPLNIQLIQSKDNKIQIGKLHLKFPPDQKEINQIQSEIESQTMIHAGNNKNISNHKIILKIFSPNVPNLSLIDLPGLVSVACTDHGQPEDIDNQIKDLIGEYIKSEKSIILAVLPARTDLEADQALGLIKKYDPKFRRTLGIITKVDLMNSDSDVNSYLDNTMSKDLSLKYGYFAIKNPSEKISIQDALVLENKFFQNHKSYKNSKRLGISNLSLELSKILADHLRSNLPDIKNKILNFNSEIKNVLTELGTNVPEDISGKRALLHFLITNLSKNFKDSIEKRGSNINTGRNLKEIFIEYRKDLEKINPFDQQTFPDNYISDITKNYEGNHMSSLIPPIEVLEYCLTNEKKPMNSLIPVSVKCAKSTARELNNLIMILTNQDSINRFPKLSEVIKKELEKIMLKYQSLIYQKIEETVLMEESYIWTDDQKFREELKEWDSNPTLIRSLLDKYFSTVKNTMKTVIPKIIIFYFIKQIETEIETVLIKLIDDCEILLEESLEKAEKREKYLELKEKVDEILQEFK